MAPTKRLSKKYDLRPRRRVTRQSAAKKSHTSSESVSTSGRHKHYRIHKRSRKVLRVSPSLQATNYKVSRPSTPPPKPSSSKAEDSEPSCYDKSLANKYQRALQGFYLESDDEIVCAICLDSVAENRYMEEINACKHHFHKSCLQRWMRKSNVCPVCRTTVHFYRFSDEYSNREEENSTEEENSNTSERETGNSNTNEGESENWTPPSFINDPDWGQTAIDMYIQIIGNLSGESYEPAVTNYVIS